MIEDPQIIRLLKSEDEKTIRTVYNEYKPGFLLFAKKYPIPNEIIIDIYQDAIVALFENAKKGKLDSINSSLKTYFFAIGKYMIYARIKKESQNVAFQSVEDVHFEWDEIDEKEDSKLQLLRTVFSKLGKQCQQILKLFYYEEKNLDEIKQIMNYENKDVAKSQKSRCIKALKELTKGRNNE